MKQIDLTYTAPSVTFLTASGTPFENYIDALYDHFNGNSSYFEIRHSGSGGFVAGPTDTDQDWEFCLQRGSATVFYMGIDPSGSYSAAPTAPGPGNYPNGSVHMSPACTGSDALIDNSKLFFTVMEWDDCVLWYTESSSADRGNIFCHVGSIAIPPYVPDQDDIEFQDTLGVFCWGWDGLWELFSTTGGTDTCCLRFNKQEGVGAWQKSVTGIREWPLGWCDYVTEDIRAPCPIILTPYTPASSRGFRGWLLRKIHYFLGTTTLGKMVRDADGIIRYMFITGANEAENGFIVPWPDGVTPRNR